MRYSKAFQLALVASVSLGVLALPVLGQDSPESILPPGFGDPAPPPRAATPRPSAPRPTASPSTPSRDPATPRLDIDIDAADRSVASGSETTGAVASPARSASAAGALVADGTEETSEDELLDAAVLPDLPPYARRPVELVGVIGQEAQGLAPDAFGAADGGYLTALLKGVKAPIASRWASILLRRTLLSRTQAPAGVNPADWVAERTWLLVRMGEADPARLLALAIDSDVQTDRMRDMALQAALASADPATACPAADHAPGVYKQAAWMMTRAMCNALSGESAQAAALVDSVQDKGLAKRIDTLLAEKVVGAAGNTRRSVKVQWDNVKALTAWRYGLATATGVEIPASLLAADNLRVRAWRARAPLRTASQRMDDAIIAAGLGVFSNQAMVDLYSAAYDETDPEDRSGKAFMQLRSAYAGETGSDRMRAIVALWGEKAPDSVDAYGRLVLTARAVALINPESDAADEADRAVASLLSAGLTDHAVSWFTHVSEGSVAWAQLALAAPQLVRTVDGGDITGLDEGVSAKRAQFFLAGLAGLGRISAEAANDAAESLDLALGKQDAWTRAIDKAAAAGQQGTVVVLAALGLQGNQWAKVDPAYLYRAVSALNRVGLQDEARLIAAEAVARG